MGINYFEQFSQMDEIKDKVVVVLGITGVGKNSFINRITKKNICEIGEKTKSCINKLKQVDLLIDGLNCYFVDTHGLDDRKEDKNNIFQLELILLLYAKNLMI